MFEAGDIREWRGHDVVDSGGRKIGTLESVYVDTGTDEPSFATVTIGLPTRHRLVSGPLTEATVGPGYLKVNYPKTQVRTRRRSTPRTGSCWRPTKKVCSETTTWCTSPEGAVERR